MLTANAKVVPMTPARPVYQEGFERRLAGLPLSPIPYTNPQDRSQFECGYMNAETILRTGRSKA